MPTTTNVHTEKVFEDELCAQLEANGWKILNHPKNAPSYSRELAIFAADLLAFVQDTQPTEWAKFKKWHNGQSEQIFVKRVAKQLATAIWLTMSRGSSMSATLTFTWWFRAPCARRPPPRCGETRSLTWT